MSFRENLRMKTKKQKSSAKQQKTIIEEMLVKVWAKIHAFIVHTMIATTTIVRL
jgi:hypothetical protein